MENKRKKLLNTAKRNTTSSKTSDGVKYPIKNGTPLELSEKRKGNIVGMSKGGTFNMQNYESFRVDIWLSDEVGENETPMDAIQRISDILDEALNQELAQLDEIKKM